jgi:hypothetical protein
MKRRHESGDPAVIRLVDRRAHARPGLDQTDISRVFVTLWRPGIKSRALCSNHRIRVPSHGDGTYGSRVGGARRRARTRHGRRLNPVATRR